MARKRRTPLSEAVDRQLYIMGISRNDLADAMGVTYQYLSLILTGRVPLSISMSRRIGDQIGMKDEELRKLALKRIEREGVA